MPPIGIQLVNFATTISMIAGTTQTDRDTATCPDDRQAAQPYINNLGVGNPLTTSPPPSGIPPPRSWMSGQPNQQIDEISIRHRRAPWKRYPGRWSPTTPRLWESGSRGRPGVKRRGSRNLAYSAKAYNGIQSPAYPPPARRRVHAGAGFASLLHPSLLTSMVHTDALLREKEIRDEWKSGAGKT